MESVPPRRGVRPIGISRQIAGRGLASGRLVVGKRISFEQSPGSLARQWPRRLLGEIRLEPTGRLDSRRRSSELVGGESGLTTAGEPPPYCQKGVALHVAMT